MRRPVWRPLLRAWMRWKWRRLDDVPLPLDRPFASVRGDAPIDCVVIGSGPISGWGVASHQLGMVGALARALARRLGRGVALRATIDPDFTIASMLEPATALPWEHAAVGVVAFGPSEILDGPTPAAWRADLERLVHAIRTRMPAGSALLVLGIPPIGSLPFLRGIGAPLLASLIARYNDLARQVCESTHGVAFVALPDTGTSSDEHRTAADYARWADVAAAAAVALRPAPAPRPPSGAAERDAAVERSGLLDGAPDERTERVVQLARRVFHTGSAAFTVLHGARQVYRSAVGVDRAELPRDQSICRIAVSQGAPLVIGDAWNDPRFAENEYVREGDGVRFYAGYPLRSPDGHYIGALCVFDAEPRDPADVDVATLRELALMIEADLAQRGAPDPIRSDPADR